MDAHSFLGLEASDDPGRWRMPVVPELSTGGGFLFGGCALAAAIAAIESTTGRPLVWATAQYLSYAKPPSVLDIEVTAVVEGRTTTQARATGRVGATEIFTVNAAAGEVPAGPSGEWAERPAVPPPSECPGRTLSDHHAGTIMDRVEARLADARDLHELDGTPGTGRSALWARVPGLATSAALLGVLGDWVPFGIGQALGARAGGRSLDNTLRVCHVEATEWVLLDVRIHAIANGFGHGLVHLWSEEGSLLGTASQSAMVRYWR